MSKAPFVMTVAEIISDAGKLEAKFKEIKTKGNSLQKAMHIAACSVLAHVGKHSDVRLVTRLIEVMPKSSRVNALRAWFEFHGPVAFGKKGEVSFVKEKALRLNEAMAKPFYDFAEEAAYVPMDIAAWLKSAISKLEKDGKETGRDNSILVTALKVHATNPSVVEPKKANETVVETEATTEQVVVPLVEGGDVANAIAA